MDVDYLKAPIETELQIFEKKFRDHMRSDVFLLDTITEYLYNKKGKQIRPMFVFYAAKLSGQINEATYIGASLIELLHTATLVHDDVVDKADERRGFLSINAKWTNKIAVLVGDFLLSKGMLLSLESHQYQLLQIVSGAVKSMSEGELLQMDKAKKLDITEDVYFEIIKKKTASLMAAACAVGAASVTDDKNIIEKYRTMGEHIGVAFQIKDDLLDYSDHDIGKPKGNDIKDRKLTLPLIYSIHQSGKKEKDWIMKIIKKHNEDKKQVRQLIQYVHESGGIDYAQRMMIEHKQKAFDFIKDQESSDIKDNFIKLVNYITERTY